MAAVGAAEKAPYDATADPEGHYIWRRLHTELATQYPLQLIQPPHRTPDDLEKLVEAIIEAFTNLVENKGLWYLLWQNGEPRHERAAQRLFFGAADAYCKANNLDVSPETDSGGGPVDFKFSSGYAARVLVEIKLSKGKVVNGYETQLEVYKQAESTTRAKYVVVDVGSMGKKLQKIITIRNQRIAKGERAAKIFEVDGNKQVSASRRR